MLSQFLFTFDNIMIVPILYLKLFSLITILLLALTSKTEGGVRMRHLISVLSAYLCLWGFNKVFEVLADRV